MVLALVSEQWRIGIKRSAIRLSNLEALVASKGLAAAEKIRDHGADQLGRLADTYAQLQAEIASLRAEEARLDDHPVSGVSGELLTATAAEARMATVAAAVTKEADEGSLKHRRVARWLKRLVPFATLLDLPVLLYFIGEVFNVDWGGVGSGDRAALGQSIVPLLTSVVFAILGTAAVAIGLHFFGRDLRGYKDRQGHPPRGKAGVVPRVYLGLSITVAIGASIVMAYRIVSDSLSAGNGITGAAILGVFFAIIVLTLNIVIFSVQYRDGSTHTDELDHHAMQLKPIRLKRHQLHQRIDQLTSQLDLLKVKAERVFATTLTKMGAPIKGADQLRLLARSYHQGCGAEAELVAPYGTSQHGLLLPLVTVDTSGLDSLLRQLQSTEESGNDAEIGEW
ncbi:hypothetical protein CJ179_39180 [Rhodococcus sp. ACS1]|uniref:hypothetical protein n=1 Tax=Rhodococcus sp. ACS1 TaxID=2028570 RepID=UPI000BB0FDA7|nr:hypothetical protein [Rhodococcus sp. ACS1]PBC38614.1 hypothetical protein CJ179_39180 [Rhodococcus sp. ACS1]